MSIREKYRLRKCISNYARFLHESKGKNKYVFIATPRHKNLGDHAIVRAQYCLIRNIDSDAVFFEFSKLEYESFGLLIRLLTPVSANIILDGGGNLGILWPEEDAAIRKTIRDYPKNRIAIFPQTAYYSGPYAEACIEEFAHLIDNHKQILFMLRDIQSYNIFRDLINPDKVVLCPDVVLNTSDALDRDMIVADDKVGLCLRDDKESINNRGLNDSIISIVESRGLEYGYISTFSEKNLYPTEREETLKGKWREFASYRLIITDRLHGMIFSAITGTPCIAMDNLSGKVSGGYEWLKDLDYIRFCDELSEIKKETDELLLLPKKKAKYDPKMVTKGYYNRVEEWLGNL